MGVYSVITQEFEQLRENIITGTLGKSQLLILLWGHKPPGMAGEAHGQFTMAPRPCLGVRVPGPISLQPRQPSLGAHSSLRRHI